MFLIFRNPAKLIKFQGLLVKKMSLCDYMRAKDDAIFIISYTVETKKDEAGNDKKSTVRNNSKMQVLKFLNKKNSLCRLKIRKNYWSLSKRNVHRTKRDP